MSLWAIPLVPTIPGADLALAASYTFDKEAIDRRGELRLQAKVSQTISGWKRWALKPADLFFTKDGAGRNYRSGSTARASSRTSGGSGRNSGHMCSRLGETNS